MAYLNGDNHGNMVLIIAKNILMEGSPLTIRVTCSNSNLTVKSPLLNNRVRPD